jgi:hypothetical protein
MLIRGRLIDVTGFRGVQVQSAGVCERCRFAVPKIRQSGSVDGATAATVALGVLSEFGGSATASFSLSLLSSYVMKRLI